MLASTLVLAACETDEGTSSSPESVASSESDNGNTESKNDDSSESTDSSENTDSSESTDSSEPDEELPEGAIEVVYCSYTEKPYFALIGTCKEGAVVTGECNGETVSSLSHHGWFSLRLRCDKSTAEVTLSQTVNGEEFDKARTHTVRPKKPGSDMWPVITGGDFQFFFQKMLPDYSGKNIPSNLAFNNVTTRVQNRLNQLRSVNPDAEIIYLLVPSSMSVYTELVPESYGAPAAVTKLDKTVDALEAGGATVIDLKALFAEHKDDEMPLYYKLDSHWSDYGAFVAYTELFNHISKKFPEAAPHGADKFDWNPDYYESGDMSYYLAPNANEAVKNQKNIKEYAYYREFLETSNAIKNIQRYRSETMLCYSDSMTWENVVRTNNTDLPSCIVMRDSYSTQIYDLIAERMNQTHYLGMWNYTWDNSLINSEKPDYVIYILAEWNLDAVING